MAPEAGGTLLVCPFCQHHAYEYAMLVHMEERHAEGDSPFVASPGLSGESATPGSFVPKAFGEDGKDARDDQLAECPVDGCGEFLFPEEMDYHLDLHAQEEGFEGADSVTVQTPPLADARASSLAPDSPPARPSLTAHHHHHRSHQHHRSHGQDNDREGQSRHQGSVSSSSHGHKHSSRRSTIEAWRNLLGFASPPSSSRKRHHEPRHHRHEGESKKSRHGSREPPASPDSLSGMSSETATPPPLQRKRLGKAELGKYAHEQRMPDWLVQLLRKGGQVQASGVLPVLEQLLEQSPTTKYAYLCHPAVQHVSKLKKEGGFCGYRNIQMMSSYINAVGFPGSESFGGQLPSIFQIQDFIEGAWDKGINAQGRVETGGVKGTRKYIGTPEAQAVFCSLGIPCEAQGFKHNEQGKSETALLQDVERYFQAGSFDTDYKVRRTNLPPIYFQHAGHSMTIVGIEKRKGGRTNLLVFDPMFHDSSSITKLVGREFEHRFPELALKPYRRGNRYLKKYNEFEVLSLTLPRVS